MRAEIEQAVQLLGRKDPKALEHALALLQDTVFSFSMKVCGQREDAEDIMQEVLMKSVRFLPQFENSKALAVWLYKVARNRCLMSRRTSKFAPKEKLSLDNLMPDGRELAALAGASGETPELGVMRAQDAEHLQAIVRQLPPAHRLVLVLHDMEGLSDQEIAEILRIRAGTVRVRLHRARLFVRKELAKPKGRRRQRLSPAAALPKRAPHRSGRCKAMFAELSDYLDEALDDSLCRELEKHMSGCRPCRGFLSSLEETIRDCRKTPDAVPDAKKAGSMRRAALSELKRVATASA